MPLDGHSYLVAQGWAGKGSGLREGAISRPLAIPQKRTLAGVGKDRDEAFPFWDHLFSAAAKSIQLKVYNSDEEFDGGDEGDATPALPRTSTGILSNRRPGEVTSTATSGTATPVESRPRYSLLVTAKREAAKQNLYSRFFRGPVLGPDTDLEQGKPSCSSDSVTENVPTESSPESQGSGKSAQKRMQDAELSESRKKREVITERVKKRTRKSRRKDEARSCNGRKETKRKRKTIVEGTPEVLDAENDADEERRRRRREKKMRGHAPGCSDDEADKKRRKKDKHTKPCSASNIPSQDMPVSEDPVYHRKERRRKE